MKKSLTHLPKVKQDELEIIRDIILEKVPDVRMIVLFGSYARGQAVEDIHTEGHTTHVYESDFDILVTTKTKKAAEDFNAHDRVEKAIDAANQVKTPYSIIYHTFTEVKERITEGHYFFTDIKKEGVHLYLRKGKYHLGPINVITPQQRKQIAEEDFKQWFKNAKNFYAMYEQALKLRKYKNAAFELHQAVECFYAAITLVFVNYRFRTHDLRLLGVKAVSYNPEFAAVFPRETADQRKAYTLLRRAYIDARYKKSYKITKKQLEYLAKRVKLLQRLTKIICKEKIESFV
ncbi:MAG: HEPN domain-containing protein [Planctomycetota bacterium]|jgi:predicted nucleotidyltransferase/HEPN domain-containing protein